MSLESGDDLRSLLERLSAVQSDGRRFDVEFTERSRVVDERTVGVSPHVGFADGPNALRVVVDRLSHQVWHLRTEARADVHSFMAEYPDAPHVAGLVQNLVEDAYVDRQRTTEFKGLRRTLAFRADAAMADDDRRPPLGPLSRNLALVEGTCQLALAGYAKGTENLDGDVRAFLDRTRNRLAVAREESSADERADVARAIVDDIRALATAPVAADEYARAGTFSTDAVPSVRRRPGPDPLSVAGVLRATGEATAEVVGTLGRLAWLAVVTLVGLIVGTLRRLRVVAALRWLAGALRLDSVWRWLLGRIVPGRRADEGTRDEDARTLEARLDAAGHVPDRFLAADGSLPADADDEFDPERLDPDALGSVPPDALAELTHADLEALGSRPDDGNRQNRDADDGSGEHTTDRSAADWYRLDADAATDQPDATTERRWEELSQRTGSHDRGLTSRRGDRDASASAPVDSSDVRAELERRGVVSDIETALGARRAPGRAVAAPRGHRLDVRAAVRREAGALAERNVYRRRRADADATTVGVAVDLSESMDAFEAKVALGALATATRLTGDEFVASGFGTDRRDGNRVVTPLITGPAEPFRWRQLDAVEERNDTPTAAGIRDVRDLLGRAKSEETLLVVVTDGRPNVPLGDTRLDGEAAIADASAEVEGTRREHGIPLIGLAVGDDVDEETMRTVFGQNGFVRSETADFASRLVDVYREQLTR